MNPEIGIPVLVVAIVCTFIAAFVVPFVFGVPATLLFLGLTAILCLVTLYFVST